MNPAILHRRTFTFGSALTLTAYADSRRALDLLGLVPVSPGSDIRPADMELFFLGGRAAVRGCGIPGDAVEIFHTDSVSVFARDGLHYAYWHGKAESVFDRVRNRAVIVMPGARYYHPDFVSRSVCRAVLDRMIWEAGCLPLHAAAVASPDGCLLTGETGAGKTTLLRGLLAGGAEFLSDDRAIVTRDGEISVYPERIRFVVSEHRRKRSALPRIVNHSPVPLRRILFLEKNAGKSRIEPLGRAESAARLLRAVSPYLAAEEWDTAFDFVERLVRRAECHVIRGWGDPDDRLRIVRNLFAECAS